MVYMQWMLQKPMLMDWYCGATLRLLDFPSMSFATGFFKVTWSLKLEGKPEIITSRKTKLCLHWANFLHYAQFMHVSSEYVALRQIQPNNKYLWNCIYLNNWQRKDSIFAKFSLVPSGTFLLNGTYWDKPIFFSTFL